MTLTPSARRRAPSLLLFLGLLGFMLSALTPAPLQGADAAPEASDGAAIDVPETLSRIEVRDLVSRLSDEQVRQLVIAQLDKVAGAEEEAAGNVGPSPEEALAAAEGRLQLMLAAAPMLTQVGALFVDGLTHGKERSFVWTLFLFAVIVFAGASAAEWVFRRQFKQFGEVIDAARPSVIDRLCILVMRLLRDGLALAVFGIVAAALFFALFQGHEPTRVFMASLFWMILTFRAISALARFALAPHAGWLRIPAISDGAARAIYRRVLILVGAVAAAYYLGRMSDNIIGDPGFILLEMVIVTVLVLSIFVAAIWADRDAVRSMILGETIEEQTSAGRVRRIWADNWHLFATGFIVVVGMLHISQALVTGQPNAAPIITSLVILFAIPVIDWLLRAGLSRALGVAGSPDLHALSNVPGGEQAPDGPAAGAEAAEAVAVAQRSREERLAYRDVLLKNLRIVTAVVVVTMIAQIWEFNLQDVAASSIGARLAESLYDIIITVILASAVWGIIRVAIRHAVPRAESEDEDAEAGEVGGKGGTRLETLIPLLGKFLLVTLVVIVALIILSSLGVDIGPLIAGAGVVGLAIGFGAQTLVKDILSGVFFLIDDAFRVGEYINVGSVQGTVEQISIRSLRLRHHNGPLHTIPFGEITHLTNFSRDWAIMKLEMRIPFDSDLEKVRKIIKKVGQSMMSDPAYADSFLQPVKSQGVHRMDDSAFIIRVKFMAKPGEQFVLRREVFRRIQEAFAENGIRFAPKRVIVDTSGEATAAAATAAAAAAAADAMNSQQDKSPEDGPSGL